MKTAVSVPDRIFEAAERLASRLGMSRSELYATALANYVDKHQRDHVTAQLNRVYGEENSQVDALLSQMQSTSIQQEEW